jgi:hypothetical protein
MYAAVIVILFLSAACTVHICTTFYVQKILRIPRYRKTMTIGGTLTTSVVYRTHQDMKATIKKLLASKETASSTVPDGTMKLLRRLDDKATKQHQRTVSKALPSKQPGQHCQQGHSDKHAFKGNPNKHGVAEHQAMKANRKTGK